MVFKILLCKKKAQWYIHIDPSYCSYQPHITRREKLRENQEQAISNMQVQLNLNKAKWQETCIVNQGENLLLPLWLEAK